VEKTTQEAIRKMDNPYKIRVYRVGSGNEVLYGKGKLDHFYSDGKGAPRFEIRLDGQEYPSKDTFWMEAINGNIVLQAKVQVQYVFTHCGGSTTFKSVDGTVKTFDTRFDHDIPCGPNCLGGHSRRQSW
jgi:hypothetical protein